MPNPFAAHDDAIHTAAHSLNIDSARDLIDWVDGAPQAAASQAAMWRAHSDAIREQIPVSTDFAEALGDFAAYQARLAYRVREAGEVFRRTHARQLRRINDPLPNEHKWDIGANRA